MRQAIILAGGKGLRFGSGTEDVPKPMAVAGGKPLLEHIIGLLKTMGLTELIIIVGYRKEAVMDYFRSGAAFGVSIEYIDNANINTAKKAGLSDAVLLVKDRVSGPFLTILGDEIYAGTKHAQMLRAYEALPGCECMIAVHRTADINEVKKNYSVKVDEGWNVLDLEEKPQTPWNDLIGCGTYIFKPSIFSYIERTPVSARTGRKELADSMKLMIAEQKQFRAFEIGGKYLNINYPEDMDTAERILKEP